MTYTDGDTSFAVEAVPGQTAEREIVGDGGVYVSSGSDDFLIDREPFDKANVEPAEGATLSGKNGTWQLQKNDDGRCWRWNDPAREVRYRVHTVKISS